MLSVPGAIIGGAVGFIAGMLEKRKVVDVYDNLLKKYPLLIDAEGNLNDAMAKSLLSSNLLDAKTKETLQYVSNLAEEYKKAKALQNVIDFQRGYNLALIEEQKIRDEMANNVFYKDSMRTIRANLSKQISLVKEYDKAMKDLEEGQVKVGTKKATLS